MRHVSRANNNTLAKNITHTQQDLHASYCMEHGMVRNMCREAWKERPWSVGLSMVISYEEENIGVFGMERKSRLIL
jgi:hypothetical protein